MRTDNENNWLCLRGLAESSPDRFVSCLGEIFKMDSRWRKQAAESKLRRVVLRSPRERGKFRGRRVAAQCGWLELTTVNAFVVLSHVRDYHVELLRNVYLSQDNEILPSTGMTAEEE